MLELGKLLHDISSYAPIAWNEEKVERLLHGLIDDANSLVIVSERGGQIVGGLAGGVTEYWFSSEKMAFDYSFFIEPNSRHGITAAGLLKSFFEWAESMGAKQVKLGITTGINVEGTTRLYHACGFQDAGALFVKDLNHGN